MSKGPPTKIVSRYGKGEMTLVTKVERDALVEGSKECGPRTIGLEDFDGPSPSKGHGIKHKPITKVLRSTHFYY
jgi:hypothetical protein